LPLGSIRRVRPEHTLSFDNLIAIFGKRPVTLENVKELAEHLWCTSHRLGFDRLLDSDIQSVQGVCVPDLAWR